MARNRWTWQLTGKKAYERRFLAVILKERFEDKGLQSFRRL